MRSGVGWFTVLLIVEDMCHGARKPPALRRKGQPSGSGASRWWHHVTSSLLKIFKSARHGIGIGITWSLLGWFCRSILVPRSSWQSSATGTIVPRSTSVRTDLPTITIWPCAFMYTRPAGSLQQGWLAVKRKSMLEYFTSESMVTEASWSLWRDMTL